MATTKKKNVGGDQLPLFLPASSWTPPTELPDLGTHDVISVDLETHDSGLAAGRGPGWAFGAGRVAGVAVAWAGGALYAPVAHPDTACLDHGAVGRWLDHHFKRCRVVFHNAPYDLGWAKREWGIEPPARLDDTTCLASMIDENRQSYRLDDLCAEEGLPGKSEGLLRDAASAYGFNPKSELWKMPARFVGPYGEGDASSTLALYHKLRPEITVQGMDDAYQLECDLIPLVLEMRRRGIRIDTAAAERGVDELRVLRDNILVDISHRLGEKADMKCIRSPGWMERVFDREQIPYERTPKSKQGSFKSDEMRKSSHWLPRLCAHAIQLDGGADKFLKTYILGYAHRGRIHATINQFKSEDGGAKTHRLSYSDPPLQQMTSRDKERNDTISPEIIKRVRGCFLPEEGEVWCSPDFSQQEYRLIVHFASIGKFKKAAEAVQKYADNPRTDYHQMVADMTGLMRNRAKDVNFAKSYGAGLDKFCLMTGLSKEDGEGVIAQYDEQLPFVKDLGRDCRNRAERTGFIRLIDGARMHYEHWEPAQYGLGYSQPLRLDAARRKWGNLREDGERPLPLRRAWTKDAMNGLIQGSAARQIKRAMRACWQEGIVPLLQMHDELDLSVADKAVGERVGEIMRSVVTLRVPVCVDVEHGTCWANAKQVKNEAGEVVYDASFEHAVRLRDEGRWW